MVFRSKVLLNMCLAAMLAGCPTTHEDIPDAAPHVLDDPDPQPDVVAEPDVTPPPDQGPEPDVTPPPDQGPEPDVAPEPEPDPPLVCPDGQLIAALPFVGSGDTTDATDDISTSAKGCDAFTWWGGNGTAEQVWRFTPDTTATYTIEAIGAGGFAPVAYVATDCLCYQQTCLGGAVTGPFQVALKAGVEVLIVVDGYETGAYELHVSAACKPDCTDKECGSDGCLGSCGECDPVTGQCSDDGQCLVLAPGDRCGDAIEVDQVPYEHSGDTTGMWDDYECDGSSCSGSVGWCNGGWKAPDVSYRFVPQQTGYYTITLTGPLKGSLVVVEDCAQIGTDCLGAKVEGQAQDNPPAKVYVKLEAGEPVFIVVDGKNGGDAGEYTLSIAEPCVPDCDGKSCGPNGCGVGYCGFCAAGGWCLPDGMCVDPLGVPSNGCATALPVTLDAPVSGDLSKATNLLDTCCGVDCLPDGQAGEKGWGGAEQVWSFTAGGAGAYTFSVTPGVESSHQVFVAIACGELQTSCLGTGKGEVTVNLDAGAVATVIVETAFGLDPAYNLQVDGPAPLLPPPADLGGGDTCSSAIPVGALPFTDTSDTCAFNNHGEFGQSWCPGYAKGQGKSSADVVYAFTPKVTGVYTLSQTLGQPNKGYGPAVISILTDCQAATSACVKAGIATGEPLKVLLDAGVPYFIIVDGWDFNGKTNACGPYTLTISEPCIQKCAAKGCGKDGCGLTCGECSNPDSCTPTGQCVALEGDSCENPFVIDALPFLGGGKTSDANDFYVKGYGKCLGTWKSSAGSASPDEVYAFTPAFDGDYEVTLKAGWQFEAVLYVKEDCAAAKSLCAASATPMVMPLKGGVTYYLIVDGEYNDKGGYSLKLRRRPELLINEVAGFVELFNPLQAPIDLAGYRLVSGAEEIALSGVLAPGGHHVVEHAPAAAVAVSIVKEATSEVVDTVLSADGATGRCPDGVDTGDEDDFAPPYVATPGESNACCD